MTRAETQKAFRTAFDFLDRQTVAMNGYPSAGDYFMQAAEEYCRLGEGADPLTQNLLVDCFEELERRWKAAHDSSGDDQGAGDRPDAAGAVRS